MSDTLTENGQRKIVAYAVKLLRSMEEEERLETFSHFCRECCGDNPQCQCWNDE